MTQFDFITYNGQEFEILVGTLIFSGTHIEDISEIEGLEKLSGVERLYLSGCEISHIKGLEYLKGLIFFEYKHYPLSNNFNY